MDAEIQHKDVKPQARPALRKNHGLNSKLPSMALDSGVLAGMTEIQRVILD